jgi:hypothetical protein
MDVAVEGNPLLGTRIGPVNNKTLPLARASKGTTACSQEALQENTHMNDGMDLSSDQAGTMPQRDDPQPSSRMAAACSTFPAFKKQGKQDMSIEQRPTGFKAERRESTKRRAKERHK